MVVVLCSTPLCTLLTRYLKLDLRCSSLPSIWYRSSHEHRACVFLVTNQGIPDTKMIYVLLRLVRRDGCSALVNFSAMQSLLELRLVQARHKRPPEVSCESEPKDTISYFTELFRSSDSRKFVRFWSNNTTKTKGSLRRSGTTYSWLV